MIPTNTVNTIDDLRQQLVSPGATLLVLGYYAPGDGGGGGFFYDDSFNFGENNLDPDPVYQKLKPLFTQGENGGTVIKPNGLNTSDPGRWRRVYDGSLLVKWFGAKGDGQTIDDGVIAAAQLDKLSSASGKFVPGDAGKLIRIQGAAAPDALCTRIEEWVTPNKVKLHHPASTAVSGAKVVWGSHTINDGVMAAGSYELSTVTGGFTKDDDKHQMQVYGAGAPGVLLTTIKEIELVGNEYVVILTNAATTQVFGATVLWGTDDWRAIQAALYTCKSAGGGEICFPSGIYRANGNLYAKFATNAHITLRGIKGAVLDVTIPNDGDPVLTVGGKSLNHDHPFQLNLCAKKGDYTISFHPGQITVSPGDVLLITSEEPWEPWLNLPKGELVEVERVDGASVVLRSPLFDCYKARITKVEKLAMPTVRVEDLEIKADVPRIGLTIEYARDVEVKGCRCSGARYAAFYLRYVFGGMFANNVANDFYDPCIESPAVGVGYGLSIGSCQYITTSGNRLFGGKHALQHGYREPVRCCVHSGNMFDNEHDYRAPQPCLDVHANAEFIEITGNIILNGVTCNGRNVAINHNLITAHHKPCIVLAPTQKGDYYRVSNNQLLSDHYGVVIVGQANELMVDSVYIDSNIIKVDSEGIAIGVDKSLPFTGLVLNNVELNNNDVSTTTGLAVHMQGQAGKTVRINRLAVNGGRYSSGNHCFLTNALTDPGHLQMRGVHLVTRRPGGDGLCLSSTEFADALIDSCWFESEPVSVSYNTLMVSGDLKWLNNVVKNFIKNKWLTLTAARLTFQNNTHYNCDGQLILSGTGKVQSPTLVAGQVQTTMGDSSKPIWAYTLSENTVAEVVANVLARDSNGNSATYKRRASVKRQQGGGTMPIGSVDVIGVDKADIAAWIDANPSEAVTTTIDVDGNDVQVKVFVKGLGHIRIEWFADVEVTLFKT